VVVDLRRSATLDAVLIVLTMSTGVIEAVSLLALGHVFTAMMTGNMLFLAFGLAGGPGLSVTASSVSLAGFAAGTLAGSALETRVAAHRSRWFVTGLAAEGVLLGAAGLAAGGIGPIGSPLSGRHYGVIALIALAMGLRSVTTLRAKVAELPTTLTTRAFTSLVGDLAPGTAAGRSGSRPLRFAGILAMFVGGILGAWMLTAGWRPQIPLLIAAAVALAGAAAYSRVPRVHPPEQRPTG
jgi:uncharacterized membrane protein YoaK (UPF0700 family)